MRQNTSGIALTGPGASAQKYDVLTAMGVFALAADRSTQRRVLRLITLVTARYNWRLGELTVGRREIARLWSVDERTVKREMGALKALGFISVKRPGSRGRVTAYALELAQIFQTSMPHWNNVGPDFAARLGTPANSAPDDKIVPFPGTDRKDDTEWGSARSILKTSDNARYQAWYAPLLQVGRSKERLILRAPSHFHAGYVTTHMLGDLARAIERVDPAITEIEIVV